MTWAERTPDQRGAELLAWYAQQFDDPQVDPDEASVRLVADVLAYAAREGELPAQLMAAALASHYLETREQQEEDDPE